MYTCKNFTNRELFRFSGVSAFPKISNIFNALNARSIIRLLLELLLHKNWVRRCVVTVFPAPDSPVMIIHCGLLDFFNALRAVAATQYI